MYRAGWLRWTWVAAVDEDAMDTAPDTDQELVLPNGSADPHEASTAMLTPPAPNEATQDEPSGNEQTPAAALANDAVG